LKKGFLSIKLIFDIKKMNQKIDIVVKPSYQNGKIYGIYYQDELIYIGSTILSLKQRFSNHFKTKNKSKIATFVKNNDKELFKMELIENYPCSNRTELCKREGYYIHSSYDTLLNEHVPGGKTSHKIVCECGKDVVIRHYPVHITSKKHIKLMESKIKV
jgi:hypothetical protein